MKVKWQFGRKHIYLSSRQMHLQTTSPTEKMDGLGMFQKGLQKRHGSSSSNSRLKPNKTILSPIPDPPPSRTPREKMTFLQPIFQKSYGFCYLKNFMIAYFTKLPTTNPFLYNLSL